MTVSSATDFVKLSNKNDYKLNIDLYLRNANRKSRNIGL